jgi:hypothetical protein
VPSVALAPLEARAILGQPLEKMAALLIPAGYAITRARADLADGERLVDALDPTMNIEIPLLDLPVLDRLACDRGCLGSFSHGSRACPDLETSWCKLAVEMPPPDAEHDRIHSGDGDTNCFHSFRRETRGCDELVETWYSCPTATRDAPIDCSCQP